MSSDENGSGERPLNAGEFLSRMLSEMSSPAGAVWIGDNGQLIPLISIGLDDIQLFGDDNGKIFLQQILTQTLTEGRVQAFDSEGQIEAKENGHATLIASPFVIPDRRPGIIVIAQPPNMAMQRRDALARHLELRCREFSRHLAMLAAPTESDAMNRPQFVPGPPSQPATPVMTLPSATAAPPVLIAPATVASAAETAATTDPKAVYDYLLSLQRSLDLNEVANVIVNDGRILFGVDRVSLAVMRGSRAIVKAVSGQESVHPRGNLIRTMRSLTEKVMAAREPFVYNGSLNAVPRQLEEPLADFIQEANARFLLIVPLIEPEQLMKPEEPSDGRKIKPRARKPIGALIVEQMSNSEATPQLKGALEAVTDHIAAATWNARSHSSIFLLPVWRTLGRIVEWLRGRRLILAVVIAIAVAAAIAALVVVPWDYRVDGTGKLMPVTQREVFAPWDGQVTELLVQGGEQVEAGQPLIVLRNDELSAELVKTETELQEKKKLLHALKAQYDEAEKQGKTDEKLRAHGKALETQVEIDGLRLQLNDLKDRRERLTVRAPIAGSVTTFQVQQLLLDRPVKRGDVLLQVMDKNGEWQLELEIAEHRVGRILKARQTLPPDLDIEYRLLTSPESSYLAKLRSLATRTITTTDHTSVLEARASLDATKLPTLTIGADVRARIGCGQSYLGDVLFGDVIEFIQKYLWW